LATGTIVQLVRYFLVSYSGPAYNRPPFSLHCMERAMNGIANLGYQSRQPHQHNTHRFIPFSINTTGVCGRAVFIDSALLPDFVINIDLTSLKGQQIIRGIERLRSTGGGINAYQSQTQAAKHMSLIESIEVYYYITQEKITDKPNGLYITNIRKAAKSTDRSGLYTIAGGTVTEQPNTRFYEKQVCINSAESLASARQQAEAILDKDGWNRVPAYEMYFVPGGLVNAEGSWISPAQKASNPEEIASELRTLIDNTQSWLAKENSSTVIKIRVFNDAVKALLASVDKSSSHIDKLDFELIDPTTDASQLLAILNHRNARLAPIPIKITHAASSLALAAKRHTLASLLAQRGLTKGAGDVLANTESAEISLKVGSALTQQRTNFVSAMKQASLLSQWAQAC
jgi:hypothetical protein